MSDSEHSGSDQPAAEITAVPERALETGDMPNCLSLLCKTDSGLAHAYVKLDAKQMKLTNVEALQAYTVVLPKNQGKMPRSVHCSAKTGDSGSYLGHFRSF